jgi:hypothetical protein
MPASWTAVHEQVQAGSSLTLIDQGSPLSQSERGSRPIGTPEGRLLDAVIVTGQVTYTIGDSTGRRREPGEGLLRGGPPALLCNPLFDGRECLTCVDRGPVN